MVWLLMGLIDARATEPQVRQDGEVVVVVARTAASPAEVRRVLADPGAVQKLFPDVLGETLEPDAGRCVRIRRQTRGLFRPLELLTRRCQTDAGYREELVTSEDFDAYHAEWVVAEDGEGTTVEYRVRTAIDVPVPAKAVTAAVKSAALRAVQALVGRW